MTVNNPFIRYKIYSTLSEKHSDTGRLTPNVTVACVISNDESDNQSFLHKVLNAAKLANTDYQIIILDKNQSISAADWKWFEQLKYILYFGIRASSTDIHIPLRLYGKAEFRNTRIIQLPALNKIESDNNEKQKLWQLLKNEFLNE